MRLNAASKAREHSAHEASHSSAGPSSSSPHYHRSDSPDDDLLVIGGLGMGGFGVVVEVAASGVKARLVMKCMLKDQFIEPKRRKQIANEVRVLTEITPSPFLLRCHLAFETESTIFLVTDLLSGGDLFFRLEQLVEQEDRDGFPEDQARTLLAEVAMGLCHLHARGFIHRDIKVENIIIFADGHAKIVDFGLALELPPENQGRVAEIPTSAKGSLIYMAPELLRQKIGGRLTDWWAFGILSYELLTGRCPWSSLSDNRTIVREIVNLTVSAPFGVSAAVGDLVTSLLRHDRLVRLGTFNDRDVLSSPFFSSVDWDTLENRTSAPAFVSPSGETPVEEPDAAAAINRYHEMTTATPKHSKESFGLLHVSRPSEGLESKSVQLF